MEVQLQNLNSDIQSLYKLCVEWNLSQSDINRGISGVFGSRADHTTSETDNPPDRQPDIPVSTNSQRRVGSGSLRSRLRWAGRCMWKVFKVSVLAFVLMSVVYHVIGFYPAADRFFSKVMQPLNYPLVRTVRLLTLPFADTLQFSGFYTMECLVDNPWFVHPPVDCQECRSVSEVKIAQRPATNNFEEDFYNRGQPVRIMDAMESNVTLQHLQEVYRQGRNADELNNGILRFNSNSDRVTSLSALLGTATAAEIDAEKKIHIEWSGRGVAAARVLRQLFPRPYFIPKESEVSLEKTVMVDGSVSKTYTLPRGSFSNTWYAQGSGSRRLIFLPRKDCMSKCKPVQVVARAGQVVNFSDMLWQVDSVPNIEPGVEPEISVAFCGTYF